MAQRFAKTGIEALEAVLLAKRLEDVEQELELAHRAGGRERDRRLRERESLLDLVVSMIERRDSGTGGHCRRVAAIAARICRELGHVPDAEEMWGFLLHDIGKICVPDAVLFKPGPLSPEEWILMRRHPEDGAWLLRPLRLLDGAIPIVLHHHERWDGSGYPLGLRRDETPLPARAFAIADAFDALTEARPYRPGRPVADAIDVIVRGRGTQFDPDCVDAFVRTVERPDFGATVRLAVVGDVPDAAGEVLGSIRQTDP